LSFRLTKDFLNRPQLKFQHGHSDRKYSLLTLSPYEPPRSNRFLVAFLKDHGVPQDEKKVDGLLTASKNTFPFTGSSFTRFEDFFTSRLIFDYVSCKEDELRTIASDNSYPIILLIHGHSNIGPNNGLVGDEVYYRSKMDAIKNRSRIQYISYDHLLKDNPFVKFNIWAQLIAKCNGTPWIVDNSAIQFTSNDTIIVGIAFSVVNWTITHGIAHLIDINNMLQKVTLYNIGRRLDHEGLYLKKDEMIDLLRQVVKSLPSNERATFNRNFDNAGDNRNVRRLNLFIYKTTPLHPEENEAINNLINNPGILSYDDIDVTHVHVKSANYGIPRLFDTDNTGTPRQYMNRQGTCAGIIPEGKSIPGFRFRGDLIVGTVGVTSRGYTPGNIYGTPKPLFLAIHSTIVDPFERIKNQVMALTQMDWEYTGENYRGLFIIKYARRMAKILFYDQDQNSLRKYIDIRDLM